MRPRANDLKAAQSHRDLSQHPILLVTVTTTDLALLPGWLSPETLINSMGSWAVLGVMLIIFAECGIL